jgi:NAD(P)-dependent dehydrogenase (short-subunit alcohol dehydrogenase family)
MPRNDRCLRNTSPLVVLPSPAGFVFLASGDARYVTGQTLYVDGGLTLHADFRMNWAS